MRSRSSIRPISSDNEPDAPRFSISAIVPSGLAFCLLLALCASSFAAEAGRERLLHLYDFEEADDQNFEDMPKHWYVIGRPDQSSDPNFMRKPVHRQLVERNGFPKYAVVKFNLPQEQKGDHNLRLSLNGGSSGAFLEVGALAAVPNSDYAVTARIRTGKLRHARARLVAYFVDAQGRRIDESAASTELLSTDEQWRTVEVKLRGEFANAAWIGMQVELLQPQHQTPVEREAGTVVDAKGKHTVVYQDVQGDAWFDDIAVWQAPRIVVRTQSVVNLIVGPSKPLLTIEVRDLSGQRLETTVGLYDHRGRAVAQMLRQVGGGEATTWQWSPTLPAYGWYLIDVTVRDPRDGATNTSAKEPVARTLRSFLWLPPRQRTDTSDRQRFTLDTGGASLDELRLLSAVATATGLKHIMVNAFDVDAAPGMTDTRLAELDTVLQPLWKQGGTAMMNLAPLPREVAQRLDLSPDNPAWLFSKPSQEWSPLITPLMLRHGQHVRRWQLGATLDGGAGDAKLPGAITAAVRGLREMTPDPRVVLPWSITEPRRADLDSHDVEYALNVPDAIRPAQLREYLRDWERAPRKPVMLMLNIAPATQMSHDRRADDLTLRMLNAWEAGVDGVMIKRPWATGGDRLGALHPDPLLAVFAGVAEQLAGRKVVGRLALGEHGHALILDGPRGPALAAWLDGGSDDKGSMEMFIGESPRAIDLWGNNVEITVEQGRHRIPLTSSPIFIEGIDAQLALFRASFGVTPKQIESSQTTHEHAITLTNPWPHTLHGELTIVEPGRDWRIDPRRITVAIEPGAKATYPLNLTLPVAEVAGVKKLVARFEFSGTSKRSVDLTAPMELGLSGIELDTGMSLVTNETTGKRDLIATAYVTNVGDTPRTLYAFAMAHDQPRQERIITLKPGQALMRRFRFENVDAATLASPIRVGLRDTAGPSLMNHVLRAGE